MQIFGMQSTRIIGALAVMTIALSACAVGSPASITSANSDPRYVTSVELLRETDEIELRSRFAGELLNALKDRGVSAETNARFVADFAVSERSAKVALQPIEQGSDNTKTADEVLPSRLFDQCKPNRVSASIVVYARDNGEVQAKSSGEFLACPGDHSQLGNLAQLLVNRTFRK